MDIIVTDTQLDKLKDIVQELIDSELNNIREESMEWGLGEMDEINEINSVDEIKIDRIVPYLGVVVYINIHRTNDREDFDNIRAELQYRLEQWVPNLKLFISELI
jgi:hypothetical protein